MNTANAPLVVANNDADAADVTDITDVQTPLADATTDVATASATSDDVKNIEDDATPLAATENNCIIHWIILVLTLVCGVYNLVRVFVRKNENSEDIDNNN